MHKSKTPLNPAILFVVKFLGIFGLLYVFYIAYLSLSSPGGYYIPFLDKHFNFVNSFRNLLIQGSAAILNLLGYQTKTTATQMLVVKHNIINVGYDCLGFAVMCFFTAFVIAYPATLKGKLFFFTGGIIGIQLLNLTRFILLSLYWKHSNVYITDHHTVFNIVVYILIALAIYFYTQYQGKNFKLSAAN
ncbi:exosortase Y [Mucilaginibacter sp.]|uniref:exosortase Y n=1 Tax=Mucilaginibacter sp. TaxID=1882438 RepID=UPI0035BBCA59